MASIPALEPFVIDGPPSALAARWKEWVDCLETYFAAAAVENDQRRPMLLHLGDAAVHKLGRSVVEEGPPYTYQSLKQALTAHFEPFANPDYERFLLRQARQFPHESVDAFFTRLKDLARTCTLVDVEDEVRAQFIQGCTSVKLREHILQVPGMSMVNILTLGRSKELSKERAAHMETALRTQDPWVVSDVKETMITAKRGPESLTRKISFYKKVYAMDFPVPMDVSSEDQDYDDVMLQSSGVETNGGLSIDVQNPGGSMELDQGSGDRWDEESIASGSGQLSRSARSCSRPSERPTPLVPVSQAAVLFPCGLIKDGAVPVACKVRKIPLSLHGDVEPELNRLEKEGIIEAGEALQ
ncbi:hypothetical protein NDU88_005690 [Pleurodeles waltl]|uniref:Retrotransposon gag domain-containing protein n=1 Tax=Pleurodeles waltl TaxID=8319 RepID=A0AAV7TUP8_PLEWA|nr:hypothetical protein NDU88_005690 [Pleurodeles waltl]